MSDLDLQISDLDLQIFQYCEQTTHKVSISSNLDLQISRFGSADFAILTCRFPDVDWQTFRFVFAYVLFGFPDLDLQISDLDLQKSAFLKTPVCKTLVSLVLRTALNTHVVAHLDPFSN